MQDAWRATQRIEGFHDAANIAGRSQRTPTRRAKERVPLAEWCAIEDAPPGSLVIG